MTNYFLNLRNRHMCDVLDEIKNIVKGLPYTVKSEFSDSRIKYVHSLIEEVRSMGRRMEAALEDNRDYEEYRRQRSELKHEADQLEKEIARLKRERDRLAE